MHFRGAGLTHHLTIFFEVVPRTIVSSTSTTRFPFNIDSVCIVLQLDAQVTHLIGRLDESAPDIMIADNAKLERNIRTPPAYPSAAGTPESGTGTQYRRRPAFTRQFLADALARLIDVAPFDEAVGTGEINIFEDAETPGHGRKGLDAAASLCR